ncbi:CAZyme family GH18 [Penicillium paradoxum]|uniref:CAZyme family GH18 n=1 Tax=Penicillium paradoxum TaxID=176176 RepID=UPI0025494B06|nr:CAZyme family GH18 [Penicillium paradoxum]KAJ5787585.1 CAZyme family GH18 [Penicillium paradoxum]
MAPTSATKMWFGGEWSKGKSCPLNVCCSDFGYCGTTKEFCGNKTVKHETCSKDSYMSRVVGYYEGWATRRPCHDFWPEQIPLGVYSHINFAFATIDPDTYKVTPSDKRDVDLYKRLTSLKKFDKDLKVMIAIGGWTFNDPGPTATVFSDLAASEEKQNKFIASLVSFMSTHDFDGIDLDWEYPEAEDRNGKTEDFKNFPRFMSRLKAELNKTPGRSELSITLPASYWYLQHFDLKALAKHVSFFNIMTYDMHGTWDQGNKWTGAFLNGHTNLTEIKSSLELLWRNDVEGDQVVMGLAFYGRSYTTQGCVEPGCVYASGGLPGPCSKEAGILLNNEIMDIINKKNLTPKLYKDATVKVVTWDDQWVSIDDRETLTLKANFAREQCLSGLMVWAISHDTPTADFSQDLAMISNRQVLMQRAHVDSDIITERTNHKQCRWSNCGKPCPGGWKMVERTDKWKRGNPEYMMDATHCNGLGIRSWCCPPDAKLPTCGWYEFNDGNCKSGCPSGMTEIGSTTNGCKDKYPPQYQSACCTVEDDSDKELSSMALYNNCEWGKFPECGDGKCSGSKSTLLGESGQGSGDMSCYSGDVWGKHWPRHHHSLRKYCCDAESKSKRFENCKWRNDVGLMTVSQMCVSGCPDTQIRVAMDGYNEGCYHSGARAYCCDAVSYTETTRISDDLQDFKDALIDWTTNVECVKNTPGLSSTNSVRVREDRCEIIASKLLVFQLTAIFTGYISGQTKHWDRLCTIWNDSVGGMFENLNTDTMLPSLFSNRTYPDFYRDGYEGTANKIYNFPDAYNRLFGEKPPSQTCAQDLCNYGDGLCDATDDEDSLSRRDLEWQQKHHPFGHLQTRAKAAKKSIICKTVDGVIKTIEYTRFAYPGPSDWLQEGVQKPSAVKQKMIEEAVDLDDAEDCGNCDVRQREATKSELKPDTGKPQMNTDHPNEIKLIPKFMLWAILPGNCDIDCEFLVNFFTQNVIPKTAPKTPHNNQVLQKPIDRIMEQIGSKTNSDVFRLMLSSLNKLKGDLWSFDSVDKGSLSAAAWEKMLENDDPRQALTMLRDVIAVYNYQNSPEVISRFALVYAGIREELERTSMEYFNQGGPGIDLANCWDRFFEIQKNEMVEFGRNYVVNGIQDMADRWTDYHTDKGLWVQTTLAQLRDRISDIFMQDFATDYMPGWDFTWD